MKLRINLYLEEFKPVADPLSLNRIVLAWGVAALGLILIAGIQFYQVKNLDAQVKAQQKSLTERQAVLSELLAGLEKKQDKSRLVAVKKQLLKELQFKNMAFRYVVQSERKVGLKYDSIMKDLAKFHYPSVWLTEISYTSDGVVLSGETYQSEAISEWLQGLKKSDYFKGQVFQQLKIEQAKEDKLLQFSFSSQHAGDVQ